MTFPGRVGSTGSSAHTVDVSSPLDAAPPPRVTLGRVAAVATLLAMALFWIYAFSPLADRDHPDRLDVSTFPVAAEQVCAAALAALDEVPPATEAVDPPDRASQLDQSGAILAAMVAELRAIDPEDPEAARIVSLWLDDWETYLGDRARYADRLRAGEDTAFVVTEKNGDQITEPIDLFASVNDMPSCATPLDV